MLDYKDNILACICIIINYFEINYLKKNLFLGFKIPQSRGSIINYKKGSRKITIIDESYNSNPMSFKFALERFDSNYGKIKNIFLLETCWN